MDPAGEEGLFIGGVTSAEDGGAGDSQPGCDVVVNSLGSPFAGSWVGVSPGSRDLHACPHTHTDTHACKPGGALSQSCERTEGRRRDGVDRPGPPLRLVHPPPHSRLRADEAPSGQGWSLLTWRGPVYTPPLSDASAPGQPDHPGANEVGSGSAGRKNRKPCPGTGPNWARETADTGGQHQGSRRTLGPGTWP